MRKSVHVRAYLVLNDNMLRRVILTTDRCYAVVYTEVNCRLVS